MALSYGWYISRYSEGVYWLIKELIHVANSAFLQCGTAYKSIRYVEIKILGISIDEEPFFSY